MAFFASTNLHRSFFERPFLPIQPERRTRESVEIERSIPIDLRRARKDFQLYDESHKQNVHREAIRGILDPTALSDTFFSQKNIDEIQRLMRYMVWKQTKHVIEPQKESTLLSIMRSIFLQYSNMTPSCDPKVIQKEVDRLNFFVLRDTIAQVLTQVEQMFFYYRDAGRIQAPIARPLAMSNAGSRELRSTLDILSPNGDPLSNGLNITP